MCNSPSNEFDRMVAAATLSGHFEVLYQAIKHQLPDVHNELLPLVKNIETSLMMFSDGTTKLIKNTTIILEDVMLAYKSLQFDLEVTRKERDDNS